MIALEILNKLEGAGFSVSFDEDIVLHGQGTLSDELKNLVQVNKQEILFHLRTREYTRLRAEANKLAEWIDNSDAPIQERRERVPEFKKLVNRIAELQPHIDHYEKSGLGSWYGQGWLLIHSNLLNELIVVVRDADVQVPEGAGAYPVYEMREVKALKDADEEQIRGAHRVKKVFKGKVACEENKTGRTARHE